MVACAFCGQDLTGAFCAGCGRPAIVAGGAPPEANVPLLPIKSTSPQLIPYSRPGESHIRVRSGYTPGLVQPPSGSMGDTDNNRFTADAEVVLDSIGEHTMWKGSPSLLYAIPTAALWAVVV